MRVKALRGNKDMQAVIRFAGLMTVELAQTARALRETNYNAKQAADLLKIKASTVRKRISRLREKLEAALGGRYQADRAVGVEGRLRYGGDDRAYRWAATAAMWGEER